MKSNLPRITTVTIASILALSACQDRATDRIASAMDPGIYVAVMGELADLRRFPPSGSDSLGVPAQTDSARQAILRAHGVTAPELLTFAETSGLDPALMETLADQISAITDSLAAIRDSVASDTGGVPPDTIADRMEITPARSSLPGQPDSRAIRNRGKMDSIRSAMKLPPR